MTIPKFMFGPSAAKLTTKGLEVVKKLMGGAPQPGYGDALAHTRKTILPLAAAMGAIGLATSQADKAISSAHQGVENIKHSFGLKAKIERIVSLQPSLAQFEHDKLVLYYEQLRHFAPDIAANDLAAAGYIKHALAMHDQGIPIATYETLAKTQNQISNAKSDAKRGPFGNSLLSGSAFRMTDKETSTDFKPFFPSS